MAPAFMPDADWLEPKAPRWLGRRAPSAGRDGRLVWRGSGPL